ncbi:MULTISPECIES: DoxX family protein [Brevibacillus]|jgi:putative oxidoreductase|uniref:DoxX family protein n=1 Tax=Brevibacillus TaxID=55080 RepID=UPI0007023BF8|nr:MULTISPECIES: DoxX family protein [Brevibacillus]PSJ66060.1 DoxX family protein [Brevibacillus brevis]RAT99516.1 DoxX family protein [Brevibacillus sp. Leaf182]RED22253.1 putative membrane protein YphA (DoxX/SURF4 family) [Brevibacillus brevis]TQK42184.1 putative membrane protein YphA (DoxX/SURF4 family) [Brevibacillus sp. AG162]VEF86357.1 DoxX [Brevibacillus brevis]
MSNRFEWSALILRVIAGLTFAIHGVAKFQMGLENVAGFFGTMGLPAFIAYLVAFLEVVGGIALILGLGTRVFAGALSVVMLGAIFKAKLAAGFLGGEGGAGYELDLALLAMLVALGISGSSKFALDAILFGKRSVE